MELRLGCRFDYEAFTPTPTIVLVEPHPESAHGVVLESWQSEPAVAVQSYGDLYGNRSRRFVLPEGETSFSYDATVEISGLADEVHAEARQQPLERVPEPVLHYLLASRYCQSDALSDTAWELFGGTTPGWSRVQAICDWIHENITYGVPSTPLTTVMDVFEARGGMCRDFAHLGVTFCRALGLPARYTFGYMPDIGVPGPFPPMDFHAWFEVWLDDRWWTFDARFNVPRIGRVPIGRGRDAVDVAMITTFGAATLRTMTVWTDEVTGAAPAGYLGADATAGPQAQVQAET